MVKNITYKWEKNFSLRSRFSDEDRIIKRTNTFLWKLRRCRDIFFRFRTLSKGFVSALTPIKSSRVKFRTKSWNNATEMNGCSNILTSCRHIWQYVNLNHRCCFFVQSLLIGPNIFNQRLFFLIYFPSLWSGTLSIMPPRRNLREWFNRF